MWYTIQDSDRVISPSLLFYKERVESNIDRMIAISGNVDRLIPHVKTHKCPEIAQIQIQKGVTKFKCATIAEAEMLAQVGAPWVLLAYQMVGPNIHRFVALIKKYPDTSFGCLVDNSQSAVALNEHLVSESLNARIFIDINNGMNRTGYLPDEHYKKLVNALVGLSNVSLAGLHVYDGHLGISNYQERKTEVDSAFHQVDELLEYVTVSLGKEPMVIAGGSPSFSVHNLRENVYLSPGTNVLWDWGYGERLKEQEFDYAALLLTRVISKPANGIVTIDLGHKAVAAENPIEKRFKILNLDTYTVLGQSEEHGVLQVNAATWDRIQVGDVFYAVPYHICPTVALHDFASVIEGGEVKMEWRILARSRRLSI